MSPVSRVSSLQAMFKNLYHLFLKAVRTLAAFEPILIVLLTDPELMHKLRQFSPAPNEVTRQVLQGIGKDLERDVFRTTIMRRLYRIWRPMEVYTLKLCTDFMKDEVVIDKLWSQVEEIYGYQPFNPFIQLLRSQKGPDCRYLKYYRTLQSKTGTKARKQNQKQMQKPEAQ